MVYSLSEFATLMMRVVGVVLNLDGDGVPSVGSLVPLSRSPSLSGRLYAGGAGVMMGLRRAEGVMG